MTTLSPGTRSPFVTVLLALVLVARLFVGPAFAAPSETGLVPLCLGGKIVYVALEGYDGPTEPAETDPVPCPWLGLGPVLDFASAPDLPAPPLTTAPTHLPLIGTPRRPAASSFQARAPPA
ncbi:MAG: hypothetical protein AAFU49_20120 [Pseudomonadota bacterium]